jgi:hypothetical protein
VPDRFKPGTRRAKLGLYLGRRGAILVLFGIAYMLIGFGFATVLMDRFSRPAHWPEEYGRQTGYIGAGAYWMIAIVVVIIAHWHDDLDVPPAPRGSAEKALLDAMIETREENRERGSRARRASEKWISQARMDTERNIQNSATENDRMIAAAREEVQINAEARLDQEVLDADEAKQRRDDS